MVPELSASPPLHVCPPVPVVSSLSAVPHPCIPTSLCYKFPAFPGLSFTYKPTSLVFLCLFSVIFLRGQSSPLSIHSSLCPPGLVLLCISIRLLFFFPSPLVLPAFGSQDGVLPALSSCAWCHNCLQHLGAAAAEKSGPAPSALGWSLPIANSIFRGVFGQFSCQIPGTLSWAYANETFQRLVTRQKAGWFFMGTAKGQQGPYLPNFKLLLWRIETQELLSRILVRLSFLFFSEFFFLSPTGAKHVFPQSYFLKWLNPFSWNIKK